MRYTGAQLRAIGEPKKPNKYGARKVVLDGYTFGSELEATRYEQLRLMQKAGEIVYLLVHPHYSFKIKGIEIGRGFTPDFEYQLKSGEEVVEEVKALSVKQVVKPDGRVVMQERRITSRDFGLRRNLMKALHGIEIVLWPPKTK